MLRCCVRLSRRSVFIVRMKLNGILTIFFQNRDNLSWTKMTYQKIIKVLGLPDGNVRQSSAEKNKTFFVLYLTHPHVCRHTYCSNMAKAGMNPKVLQYLMGHSDIGVTLNVYTLSLIHILFISQYFRLFIITLPLTLLTQRYPPHHLKPQLDDTHKF